MTRAIDRSILDLPLEDGRSLLWHRRDYAVDLRCFIGLDSLEVRVLWTRIPRRRLFPALQPCQHCPRRDAFEYRGGGGVLRDAAAALDDDDVILVASAAQALLMPLPDLAAALRSSAATPRSSGTTTARPPA